jgi:SpoU rRNA methylase family enzyme
MPIKNVLDTARRLGIPVVIMDEAGEAAQVVMPFEDFAAMVGATSPAPRKPRVTRDREDDEEVAQALAELTLERFNEQESSMPDEIRIPVSTPEQRVESTRFSDKRLQDELGVGVSPGDLLEDHFYLEPIDDEKIL